MSGDDNTNELTWLKEGGKKPELSPIRPPDRGDEAPSWLYEDTVPDHKGQKAGKAGQDNKAPKGGGIKWKQHISTKPAEEDSGDVDSDSCCCCFSSDPMLFAFQCFHITAGLSGLGAFVANIYVFSRPHITVKEVIIRGYSLIFCLLMVATELDWRYIVNKARFLDWWVLRGLFYTFIGFITFGLADHEAAPIDTPEDIVGFIVFLIGICYMLMGTFCMKSMKQRRMIEIIQRGGHISRHSAHNEDSSHV